MAGSGRVPGKEAGSGCLCLFLMWRREDSGPGTGLWSATKRERERVRGESCQRAIHSYSFTNPGSERGAGCNIYSWVFMADRGETEIDGRG